MASRSRSRYKKLKGAGKPFFERAYTEFQSLCHIFFYFMKFKNLLLIEQKGMTFDHDFSNCFRLFSSLLKKRGKMKRRMNQQKSWSKIMPFCSISFALE